MDIASLAFCAAETPYVAENMMERHKVAVVRITEGDGIIGCFAETVAAVIRSMGATVFIPGASDVAGIYEAAARGAEILFMADDDRFIAMNIRTGRVAENDSATARGYVSALSAAAGGLSGRSVLQLGFGRLGKMALERLLSEGAYVRLYDSDREKTASMRKEKTEILSELPLPLSGLVFDATNEGGYIGVNDISGDILIASPGIPLSLDDAAFRAYQGSVIHDPLQTGVAVMLAMVTKD